MRTLYLVTILLFGSFAVGQEEPVDITNPPGIVACNYDYRPGHSLLCFAEYPVTVLGPVETLLGVEWHNGTLTPYTGAAIYTESYYVNARIGYGFGGNNPDFKFSVSAGMFMPGLPTLFQLMGIQ